jgi:hypothetical protein
MIDGCRIARRALYRSFTWLYTAAPLQARGIG